MAELCLAGCARARCSWFLLSSAVVLQFGEALAQRSTRVDSRRRVLGASSADAPSVMVVALFDIVLCRLFNCQHFVSD